ncbi:MAG TPA: hypothetical protein VMC43_00170, partial [Candidatus Paceibacterota bacterium]|nr:hypothetical protein [Candidatus Paceibacterota bacterium]
GAVFFLFITARADDGQEDMRARASFLKAKAAAMEYAAQANDASSSAVGPQVEAHIVASSSDVVFAYPHATLQIGDELVIGTAKEEPGHIIVFPDLNDLGRYTVIPTPGFKNLAEAAYDPINKKVYFASMRLDNQHFEVLSLDPATLVWAPVFEFKAVQNVGLSTIQTDGVFVYAGTQSTPAYLIKTRIADWSLAGEIMFSDLPGFHSSKLYTYSDRSEWYVNTFSIPTVFFKVNPADFTYTSTTLAEGGDVTDDVYFRPMTEKGGLFYEVSENYFGLEVIDTATMSATHYLAPGSYGLFSNGTDLYSLDAHDGQIIKYPKFQIQKPVVINLPDKHRVNEWFRTSSGKTFFTDFSNPSAIYQYVIVRPKSPIGSYSWPACRYR